MKSTSLRYALYPGPVVSRSDGDTHHIGAAQLRMLYGVREDECLVVDQHERFAPQYRKKRERASALIPLTPRSSGNYTLPPAAPSTIPKGQQ